MWIKRIFRFASASETGISLWLQLFGATGIIGSFGVGTWAASASDWLNAYGPISWVLSGALCAVAMTFIYYLINTASYAAARADLAKARLSTPHNVNILEDHFDGKIIKFVDLFDTLHPDLSNKHFKRCRFSGPMIIYLGDNITLDSNKFIYCSLVVSKNYPEVLAGAFFEKSTFFECEFDLVTIIMAPEHARELKRQTPGQRFEFMGYDFEAKGSKS